jgi:uncharacterized protein (TIGR02678 family)
MIDVRDSELGDCQQAARTLLVYGVVTASRPSEAAWRHVRRYAEALDAAFREVAGYAVSVGRTAVRLVRRLDRLVDSPVFTTPSGRPFDRSRYALVVLALAALERLGSQTTLTVLARRVRQAAESIPELAFDPDAYASRLALGHAVRVLEELGALSLTDGSREAWEQGRDDAEALYDLDRSLCRQVFPLPRGLQREAETCFLHADPAGIGRDPERRARRQRLARRLLEEPSLYLSDLDESERAFLHKEGRTLAADLERLTGATVERRREGLALVDPGQRFSDRPFPSGGAAQQAALLLATRLCALAADLPTVAAPHGAERSQWLAARIAAAGPGSSSAPAPAVLPRASSPFVEQARLVVEATRLRDELGVALKADHRDDPERLLTDALAVLAAYDLVRPVPGGFVLMPAIARFREVRVAMSAEVQAQIGLFGDA